jgi:general secretion pathway protein B
MSILLKALKKSEAQRQVGQPPDIHAATDLSVDRSTSRNKLLLIALLVISAGVTAYFGYQEYRGPDELAAPLASGEEPEAESGVSDEGESEEHSSNETVVDNVANSANNLPMVANFPASQTQDSEDRKQKLSQSFTEYDAGEDPELSDQVEPDSTSTENMASNLDQLTSTFEAIGSQEPEEETAGSGSKRRASRPEAGSSSEPVGSEPISFWQVPQDIRDSMPEFRITVLVYAEAPEDRFVLVNGARLKETEELAPGVILDEIRRDGAVFQYQNYRFLIKG